MKKTIIAIAFVATFAASPTLAGSLSDPVVTSDVVADDAVSSSDDTDTLLFAIWAMLFITTAAGAF